MPRVRKAASNSGKNDTGANLGIVESEGESRTLGSLRDTLLPKLVAGKLRVMDAEKIVAGAL